MKSLLTSPGLSKAIREMVRPGVWRELVNVVPEQRGAMRRQWSQPLFEQVQRQKLQRLIKHTFSLSPYYRQLAERIDIAPDMLQDVEKLSLLPTLRAEDLDHYCDEIYIPSAMETTGLKAFITHTSGTSGFPKMVFHLEDADYTPTAAVLTRCFNAWGIGNAKVMVWVDRGISSPFLAYHTGWHLYYFYPPWELVDEPELLRTVNAEVLIGSPYDLKSIARVAQSREFRCRLQAVITTYDLLDAFTRSYLTEAFGTRPFEFLSLSECSCPIAWECPTHYGLHANADYVMLEVLHMDTDIPVQPGEVGEIVVTDLHNYLMPLLRYRTGDLAAYLPQPCDCGRALPLLSPVYGRTSSILRRESTSITVRDLLNALDPLPFGIGDIQLDIEKNGGVVIRYVQPPSVEVDENELTNRVQTLLDRPVTQIEAVPFIEPTIAGKYPTVIQL